MKTLSTQIVISPANRMNSFRGFVISGAVIAAVAATALTARYVSSNHDSSSTGAADVQMSSAQQFRAEAKIAALAGGIGIDPRFDSASTALVTAGQARAENKIDALANSIGGTNSVAAS
ncbi:MAG: hypothetical protein ABI305_12935, partial [Tepidiformaceae bacterium]